MKPAKLEYVTEVDIMMVTWGVDAKFAHSAPFELPSGHVIVDVSTEGAIYDVEILDAQRFIGVGEGSAVLIEHEGTLEVRWDEGLVPAEEYPIVDTGRFPATDPNRRLEIDVARFANGTLKSLTFIAV